MIISNKKLNIEFFDQPNYVTESKKKFENLLLEFLDFFSVAEINLEISFCTSSEIKKINKEFRSKDKPTNVLSFPDEEIKTVSNSCNGEILICNEVLEKEAQDQDKDLLDHFQHLVIHSMLHILGYGHDETNDAILMENKEVKFLSKIGISDPYK
tara:strand:+ start:22 stop:486 length:465 start_codon:yes stop_codon:yes gene_type:complete